MTAIGPASVLCVASDNGFVSDLKQSLEGSGVGEIHSVTDLDNVLEAMATGIINVVLIRDELPTLDAVELCKTVRTSSDSPNIRVPIVLICTDRNLQRTVEASNAGANEVLLFPFNEDKLAQRLLAAYHDRREFVESEFYVGPERRSLKKSKYGGILRRASDQAAEKAAASASGERPAAQETSASAPEEASMGPYQRSQMARE